MSSTIPLSEIATLLGVKPSTAARKCRLLSERHGFPRPLPGCPTMFSRGLVEAWLHSGGQAAPAADNDAGPLDVVGASRAALEARYVQR